MVGWREWVALPELGIHRIKAKVDTGARTSSLHAWEVERYRSDGIDRLRFIVHPLQRNIRERCACDCVLLDERQVTDSGGHRELRYVIETGLLIAPAPEARPIEITLTNRDLMQFRMLVGRTALRGYCSVDPAASYLTQPRPKKRRPPPHPTREIPT